MPVKVFTLPFDHEIETFHDEDVNDFILKNAVQEISANSFSANEKFYWTLMIRYETAHDTGQKEKTEELSKNQQQLLQKLFAFRKERAEKDGIPVFIVATNKQLKDVVLMKPRTVEQLKQINGFGKKKIQLYGPTIIAAVSNFYKDEPKQKATPEKETEQKMKKEPPDEQ